MVATTYLEPQSFHPIHWWGFDGASLVSIGYPQQPLIGWVIIEDFKFKFERNGDHHYTTTHTTQQMVFFHSRVVGTKIYFTHRSFFECVKEPAYSTGRPNKIYVFIRWTGKVLRANPVRVFMSGDLGGKQSHAFPQKTIKMN